MSLRGKTMRRAIAASALAGAVIAGLSSAGHRISAQTPPPTATPAAAATVSGPTPASNLGGPAGIPTRFSGSVRNASGAGILNGTVVVVSAGGTVCGTGTVVNGQYTVDASPIGACATPGTAVTFTVGGQPAQASGDATTSDLGAFKAVNLTIATATPTPAPTTPAPATTRPPTSSPTAAAPRPTTPAPAAPLTQERQRSVSATFAGAVIESPSKTLVVGQTMRIRITFHVTNTLNVPIDYSHTFPAEPGPSTQVTPMTQSGPASVAPGESFDISYEAAFTPTAADIGHTAVIMRVRTLAVTADGQTIDFLSDPVTTDLIGADNGGVVVAGGASGAGGATVVAPRPVTVTVPASGLPQTGTGSVLGGTQSLTSWFPLVALLLSAVLGALGAASGITRRDRLD